jgi:putative transposase
MGDIKSHDIVKNKKRRYLNRNMNDLKFYKFKTRLEYKCKKNGKLVYYVNESYTTQTCSSCGTLNKTVGINEIYTCIDKKCGMICGRDINAAKNISMRGILEYI